MPRVPTDIIANGPIIDEFPEEVSLTSNSITLEWHTINLGTSRIRYEERQIMSLELSNRIPF